MKHILNISLTILLNLSCSVYSMEDSEVLSDYLNPKDLIDKIVEEKLSKYKNEPANKNIYKFFTQNLENSLQFNISIESNPSIKELKNYNELLLYIFRKTINSIFTQDLSLDCLVKESLKFIYSIIIANKFFYYFRNNLIEYLKVLVTQKLVHGKFVEICQNGDKDFARILLSLKTNSVFDLGDHKSLIDVNASNENGLTPLIAATLGGQVAMVKMLLKYTSIINQEDHEGKTALDYAISLGHDKIVQLLHSSKKIACSTERGVDDILVKLELLTIAGFKDYTGIDLVQEAFDSMENDYKVIGLYFNNQTDDTFIIRGNDINLNFSELEDISKFFHGNNNIFFVLTLLSIPVAGPFALLGLIPMLNITYDNSKLDDLFKAISMHKNQTIKIKSHTILNKVIFINKSELSKPIILKLLNKTQDKEIIFNYNLQE